MAWYLDDKETSTRTPLKDGDIVGREGSHAYPHMLKMSRQHCKFVIENDLCYILDLGSKNGTVLDGKECAPNVKIMVNDGAMLAIGEKIFRIRRSDKTQTLQIQPLALDEAKRAQPLLRPDQKIKAHLEEEEVENEGLAKKKKLKTMILMGLGLVAVIVVIKFLM
jgi:pSer/pThr/pTyr-binding forkhead associated (FHA) protein